MINLRRLSLAVALNFAGLVAVLPAVLACSAKAVAQELEWQSSQTLGVPPAGADMFQLNDLESFKKYSRVKNFEIVGHAYLRGSWINPAFAHVGMATNTMRVCDKKVAYLAGYNPIVFGVLIVDVSDPADMKPLSFIPAHPGMKATYLRVSCARQILAFDQSGEQPNDLTGARAVSSNPNKPKPGEALMSGVSFYDVADPRNPKLLGEWRNAGGLTHGMEMDDSYVYVCGTSAESKKDIQVEELNILSYDTPSKPELVSRFHIVGQHVGETFAEGNRKNPNGSDQMITCHEIQKDNDRLYLAYRDEGVVILDITNPAKPVRIDGGYDYSPPFNGDPGLPREGCCPGAHTLMPAHHTGPLPTIAVLTDEHFNCPPGFGRIIDITYPKHITLLSTYHISGVDDQYDFEKKQFICPEGSQESAHMAEFDHRVKGGNLFYQAWYNQGLRAIDISNPFRPREVGYYISPDFSINVRGQRGRHTREPYPDWDSDLIYVTDGNGGGLTVLRYTGPLPTNRRFPASGKRESRALWRWAFRDVTTKRCAKGTKAAPHDRRRELHDQKLGMRCGPWHGAPISVARASIGRVIWGYLP